MKYTTQELQTKLEVLREQYKKSTVGVDKKVLEIRGKILKRLLEKRGQLL